ncbi:MAG TPA: hypothetical protein VGE85_12875 [Terracidiphilus sp.]
MDDFAGNSFFLKILQRIYACNPMKTMRLHPNYRWGYTMCQLCRHIKTDGFKCQSPAMRGSDFCYFHSRVQTMTKVKNSVRNDIKLPLLVDSASIQAAISQIAAASLSSRLDARHTGLLLYALQIASQNITRSTSCKDSKIVHSMTVTGDGDALAPEMEICGSRD